MATIKGMWRWNNGVGSLSDPYHVLQSDVNFSSNGEIFSKLKVERYAIPTHVEIYYDSVIAQDCLMNDPYDENNDGDYDIDEILNETYRIMDFGEDEQWIDDELYAFILANATEYSPIAEKLEKIAENVPKVFDAGKQQGHGEGYDSGYDAGLEAGKELGGYNEGFDAGKQAEYDAFWDTYQQNGTRYNYQYAFCDSGWNDDTFKPKYDIILGLGYTGYCLFWRNSITDIAAVFEERGLKFDTTLCGNMANMFQIAKTVRIPELNCTHAMDYCPDGLYVTFANAKVETIDKLIVTENLKYVDAFKGCANLKNIVFDGVIGQDINFQWSTLLTRASIESIVNALSDDATGKTLTLSKAAVDKAFETSEGANDGASSQEWDSLEGLKMNWEITLV